MRWSGQGFELLAAALAVSGAAPVGGLRAAAEPASAIASDPVGNAEAEFSAASFDRAEATLSSMKGAEARSYRAELLRGRLRLLRNRFGEAERALRAACVLEPSAKAAKLQLAELFVRQDRYAEAAVFYAASGQAGRAAQAEAVGAAPAYQIEWPHGTVRIKADRTDPLMVVSARINGGPPVHFLLDTGGSQVLLDKAFADETGVKPIAQETGEFSGGKTAPLALGRIDEMSLSGAGGGVAVRNIPVQMLDTRRFSAVFGGLRIDGVIGTQFLYHFRATVDYPNGELVLRRPDAPDTPHEAVVPIWMGGDHFMVGMGALNGVGPLPFFPDTGLAGLAFTAPASTLSEAGVKLTEPEQASGEGGGGAHAARPIQIERLSFGPVAETGLMGVAGAFPPSLEHSQGYRIAGIISHAFFRPYAVTFDFRRMQIDLDKGAPDSAKRLAGAQT